MRTKQAILLAHGRLRKPDGEPFPEHFRWRVVHCRDNGTTCQIKAKRQGRHQPWFATVRSEALKHLAAGVLVTLERAASRRHDPIPA